ncbi:MAG: transcriptional regulator [Cyanobacteria bacterium J06638_20]
MTLTFNSNKYSELLSQYQPRRIRTEEENERALAIVEALMHRSDRSPEENELYDLLILLIETFETEAYQPGTASSPHSMLQFLMEQQELTTAELSTALGSEAIATAALTDDYEFSISQIKALGKLFKVDPSVFV